MHMTKCLQCIKALIEHRTITIKSIVLLSYYYVACKNLQVSGIVQFFKVELIGLYNIYTLIITTATRCWLLGNKHIAPPHTNKQDKGFNAVRTIHAAMAVE